MLVAFWQGFSELAVLNDIDTRYHGQTLHSWVLRNEDRVASSLLNILLILVCKVLSLVHLFFNGGYSVLELVGASGLLFNTSIRDFAILDSLGLLDSLDFSISAPETLFHSADLCQARFVCLFLYVRVT